MCPHDRGIGNAGSDHSSIDPLCNIRAGAPVPPGGRQESVQEVLGLVGLGEDVVVPPEATIKDQAKILGAKAVWDGVTRYGENSGRCGTSTGKEDDMGLRRVEGKTTVRPPTDKAVNRTLNTGYQFGRIRTATEHSTIILKSHPKGVSIVFFPFIQFSQYTYSCKKNCFNMGKKQRERLSLIHI